MLCENCNDERFAWVRDEYGTMQIRPCSACCRKATVSGPLVSICIPTYNRVKHLRSAILSCLAQTYSNIEIIVTDNSDDGDAWRESESWRHPKLSYCKNDGDIGCANSINRGVSLARGKYVKVLMDDDLLFPDCIATQVAALEQNDTCAVAMSPLNIIDENGELIFPAIYGFKRQALRFEYRPYFGLVDRKSILKDFLTRRYPCAVPSGVLFRKAALDAAGPFSVDAGFATDIDMYLRLAASWDFYYVDKVLASWRYVPDCHTKRLHDKGMDATVFYRLLGRTVADERVKAMFPDIGKLVKDGLLFCSMRTLMNMRPAIRNLNIDLFFDTIRIIAEKDCFANWLRLPFRALREVLA